MVQIYTSKGPNETYSIKSIGILAKKRLKSGETQISASVPSAVGANVSHLAYITCKIDQTCTIFLNFKYFSTCF